MRVIVPSQEVKNDRLGVCFYNQDRSSQNFTMPHRKLFKAERLLNLSQ